MALHVRELKPVDHSQWLPLWRGYQRFYETDIPPEVSDVTWRRFHDPAEPMWASGAFDEQRLVGIVHCILHRSCWTVEDYCYLQDLFVDPTTRGAGVGRALIEHVYEAARAKGAGRVHWLTKHDNHQAMLLYDRIASRSGFVQYRQIF